MKITAVAAEDLESKGLGLLENEMELETKENAFPDTYGECIGRYDKSTGKYESFFKKDIAAGNTNYFDQYREKCHLFEKHWNVYDRESNTTKQVVDYFVIYNIKESSKNSPTEIEDHVDGSICLNGYYKSQYELLFAYAGTTRRVIVEHSCVNIPMYEFVKDLEELVEAVLCDEAEEDNPFFNVIKKRNGYYAITMFDEIGINSNVEFDRASELMAMLVSVRLLGCEFIEEKSSY